MTAAELISNSHPVLAVHEVALYQGTELAEFLRDISAGDLRSLLTECNTVMGACWQEAARRRTEARWNGHEVDVEDIPEPQHPDPEPLAVDEVEIRDGANQVVRIITLPVEGAQAVEPAPVPEVESTTLIAVQGSIEMPADTGLATPAAVPAHTAPDSDPEAVLSVVALAHAEGVTVAHDAVSTGLIGPVEAIEAALPKRRPSPRPRDPEPTEG